MSQPIVVPLTPLPTGFPLEVKVKANVLKGIILLSPLELVLDQPIHVGCFNMKAGEHSKEVGSAPDCLVHCNEHDLRFALLTKGNQCSCASTINYAQFTLISEASCREHCQANLDWNCGGSSTFSLYVASMYTYLKVKPIRFYAWQGGGGNPPL